VKHAYDLKAKRVLPLELSNSWPLYEQPRQFELGYVLNSAAIDVIAPLAVGSLEMNHTGCWECDLADESLIWSGGVYDIFGLPRGSAVSREEAVGFYCEGSRAAMERLRAHAIRHNRGFTIDVEIRAAIGERRWVRLIGAPVFEDGRAVRLHGLKLII
jgi:PAS domain-containing protein